MKKIILVLIVSLTLSSSLISCDDYEEKATNEIQQIQQDQHIQYKDSGKDEEPDPDNR